MNKKGTFLKFQPCWRQSTTPNWRRMILRKCVCVCVCVWCTCNIKGIHKTKFVMLLTFMFTRSVKGYLPNITISAFRLIIINWPVKNLNWKFRFAKTFSVFSYIFFDGLIEKLDLGEADENKDWDNFTLWIFFCLKFYWKVWFGRLMRINLNFCQVASR